MVMQRWDPFRDLRNMEDTMNRLWRGFGGAPSLREGVEDWNILIDVIQKKDDIVVKAVVDKINSTARIRVKEPSIKVSVGKQSLDDKHVAENALTIYNKILEQLPRGKDNVKNVKIKYTMDKPVHVEI